VSKDADLEALVAATLDEHGQIDILVNNAGLADPQPAEIEPLSTFRYVLDGNLTSAFVLTQLVAQPRSGSRQHDLAELATRGEAFVGLLRFR
jgi:NAD(P)-dependent dehydrogenase (short-subunit alcohol dehydrogenase family)